MSPTNSCEITLTHFRCGSRIVYGSRLQNPPLSINNQCFPIVRNRSLKPYFTIIACKHKNHKQNNCPCILPSHICFPQMNQWQKIRPPMYMCIYAIIPKEATQVLHRHNNQWNPSWVVWVCNVVSNITPKEAPLAPHTIKFKQTHLQFQVLVCGCSSISILHIL